MSETKTDVELVAACNALAREFYLAHGYGVPDGYRFDAATHPQEVGMWNLAVLAYDFIAGTDIENALCNLDEHAE